MNLPPSLRAFYLFPLLLSLACHPPTPTAAPSTNGVADSAAETVILISLDGLRWDFPFRTSTPTLDRLAAEGVRAERMIPAFPSKTFPNHYTQVTGLWPEEHGILANTFYDPVFDKRFSLGDREAVADGRWWGGEPIWVTAERQGLVSATLFWPGSEAEIGGIRPSYWLPYQHRMPHRERVQRVLNWLDLPAGERPSFLTLYFSDVDSAAHDYGPDAPQVAAAVTRVDAAVGLLVEGLEARGLWGQIHLVVVADHGMAATSEERLIFLEELLPEAPSWVVDWSPVVTLWPPNSRVEEVYRSLHEAHPALTVYRREEIPERFHYRDHRRASPILGVAAEGWTITTRQRFSDHPERFQRGHHGYDPALPSMGALFLGHGPQFKKGITVPPFENIHLYELMCFLLKIEPAPNSGDLSAVASMMHTPPEKSLK